MNKLKHALITGIGAMLPLFLTIYVVVRSFNYVDSWLQSYIEHYFGHEITGLGFLVVVILVIFIGLITNTYFATKITHMVDWVFMKIPFIKQVYTTIRGIVSLSKPNENSFKKVVLVEFPTKGIKSIGFITKENLLYKEEGLVSVFIPTTPNPTNGFLIYVKPEQFDVLDLTVEEGIKAVISVGSLTPMKIKSK